MRLFEYQRTAMVTDAAALLRRIVLNLAINHYHRELSVPVTFESLDRLDRCGALADPAPGPERTLAAEQELECVISMLGAVSPRTCQIFIAQRGGYSYVEIASAFVIKPRTVEKHVMTAAEALGEHSHLTSESSLGSRSCRPASTDLLPFCYRMQPNSAELAGLPRQRK